MKRINTSHASMGVAAASLFIALGGPAQAADLVTGKDIKNSSITGKDIKNKSLTASDFKGSLKGAKGPAGPSGPKGDKGDAGDGVGNTRFVLVDRDGKIESQSGGFRIANAYPAGGPGEANVYIESGDKDLSNNGIVSTIALENQYSLDESPVNNGRNPGSDTNPEFSGEITNTKCLIPGVVVCAPPDLAANGGDGMTTNRNNYFVVSPRNSDGSFTGTTGASGPMGAPLTQNTHKRFYVIITGDRD